MTEQNLDLDSKGAGLPADPLAFARYGWFVFPVFEPKPDGSCSCGRSGCPSTGKHPRVSRGFYAASTNEEQIVPWTGRWPDANWGIRTGSESGLLVLDIDPRNGGDKTLARLQREHGDLPRTVESVTGGGGRHIYFAAPPLHRAANGLGPGVDVKFEKGYVIAPGSRHATGRLYAWKELRGPGELELSQVPEWLLTLLSRDVSGTEAAAPVDMSKVLGGVPEGERNTQLFRLACMLRGEAELKSNALRIVLEAAANCEPPFPVDEAEAVVERAYRYPAGNQRPGGRRIGVLDDAVARLRSGPDGKLFQQLWLGDTSAIPQQADPAYELCSLLVPAVGPDVGLIDAHFRASALFSAGWDYRRPGAAGTTGADTLSRVIDTRLAAGTRLFADAISLEHRFAVDAGGLLYVYERGVYRPGGRVAVERRFKELTVEWGLDKLWSTRRLKEVLSYIQTDAPNLWERPPEGTLNVLNGLLDLDAFTLSPHSPDHLSSIQLNVAFDPDATCPSWEKQVADTFPQDAQGAAWQIVAFLMNPIDAIQKAILLVGRGANGKSVFLDGIQELLGRDNVTNLSLQKLASDRFAVARLEGKLANICADLPSKHLEDTSVFKQIVSHDRMNAEHKQKTSFEFTPFCGLVFSANYPPSSSDSSLGYKRRWFVVRFDQEFRGAGVLAKGELVRRLTAPNELSGLLNKALEARAELLQRNDFEGGTGLEPELENSVDANGGLASWLERHTKLDGDPDGWVAKHKLHDAYARSCRAEGVRPPTSKAFGRSLRLLRLTITDGRKQVDGQRSEVWYGIELLRP